MISECRWHGSSGSNQGGTRRWTRTAPARSRDAPYQACQGLDRAHSPRRCRWRGEDKLCKLSPASRSNHYSLLAFVSTLRSLSTFVSNIIPQQQRQQQWNKRRILYVNLGESKDDESKKQSVFVFLCGGQRRANKWCRCDVMRIGSFFWHAKFFHFFFEKQNANTGKTTLSNVLLFVHSCMTRWPRTTTLQTTYTTQLPTHLVGNRPPRATFCL